MQLVGAMVTQPQAIASHQDELRAALGKQGVESLQKAAKNLRASASKDSVLQAQFNNLRSGLDLNDAGAVQELGARLNTLFDNSKSRVEGASGGDVASSDSKRKRERMSKEWKLQRPDRLGASGTQVLAARKTTPPVVVLPATEGESAVYLVGGSFVSVMLPMKKDQAYADQFSRILGVDSIDVRPVTRAWTYMEHRTGRTDVYVNFHSAEALAAARKSGSLPLFGNLRGWFTGYHVIARVSPEAVERERLALDESYRERFAKIPGVNSVKLSPITWSALWSYSPTGRTDIFVNFQSAEALEAAERSGSLPLFGNLRGWFTRYHVIARVNP